MSPRLAAGYWNRLRLFSQDTSLLSTPVTVSVTTPLQPPTRLFLLRRSGLQVACHDNASYKVAQQHGQPFRCYRHFGTR